MTTLPFWPWSEIAALLARIKDTEQKAVDLEFAHLRTLDQLEEMRKQHRVAVERAKVKAEDLAAARIKIGALEAKEHANNIKMRRLETDLALAKRLVPQAVTPLVLHPPQRKKVKPYEPPPPADSGSLEYGDDMYSWPFGSGLM